MKARHDMLGLLSECGVLKKGTFKKYLDANYGEELGRLKDDNGSSIDKSYDERNTLLRLMEELGHCEDYGEKASIHCCKPAFSLLPRENDIEEALTWARQGYAQARKHAARFSGWSAVYTGSRGNLKLRALRSFVDQHKADMFIDERAQSWKGFPLPSALTVVASDPLLLLEAAEKIGAVFVGSTFPSETGRSEGSTPVPAAWRLLQFSADLDDYKDAMMKRLEEGDRFFEPPDMVPRAFSQEKLHFVKDEDVQNASLFEYRFRWSMKNDVGKWLYVWKVTGDRSDGSCRMVYVDRDWGRYLALERAGADVLLYDREKHLLGVPENVRLPIILARAATFCSGRVAQPSSLNEAAGAVPKGSEVRVYQDVPEAFAKGIAGKLGQNLFYDSGENFSGQEGSA